MFTILETKFYIFIRYITVYYIMYFLNFSAFSIGYKVSDALLLKCNCKKILYCENNMQL